MVFTPLQSALIASVAKDLAIRLPGASGDLINIAIGKCLPGSSVLKNPNRPRIAKLLPLENSYGCRPWLHNLETATRKGKTFAEAVEYADSWGKVYENRG